MITDSDNDVAARVLERLDRLEADNAELRSEMSSLRRRRLVPTTPTAGDDSGEGRTKGDHDEVVTRRGVLSRLAGAGAAGVGLVGGASVLSTEPAGATDLGFLQLGHANSVARSTGLFNSGTGPALAVFGGSGVGVRASGDQAPLHLVSTGTAGPPTGGSHEAGEVMLDRARAMFVCVAGGTPGRWMRVGFNGVIPTRVADTRPGTGTPYSTGPIGPGAEREITVTGVTGVPGQAGGVVMNATAVSPTAASYITIYPNGVARPVASNLNVVAGGPHNAQPGHRPTRNRGQGAGLQRIGIGARDPRRGRLFLLSRWS